MTSIRILFVAVAILGMNTAHAGQVLFVDDDEGQNSSLWFNAMNTLGISYDVETLGVDGNPGSNFGAYDQVIWSIGDRAYTNLTGANVSKMTSYLDNGGRLLYTGGHNLYNEPNAGGLASSYLGVSAWSGNMPTFGTTTMSGTGHAITGSNVYSVAPWSGGQWGNMMTGFNVTTATALINKPVGTGGGPYVAAINELTSGGTAVTWGFDLGHMTNNAQRLQLLGDTLGYTASVPAPASITLFGLGLMGLAWMRRRQVSVHDRQCRPTIFGKRDGGLMQPSRFLLTRRSLS